MKFIDTHSHLYSKEFDADIENVIARSKAVLSAVYLPNIDYHPSRKSKKL